MMLEPCIILKFFLTSSDSEPEYSYKPYSYKEGMYAILIKPHFYKKLDYKTSVLGWQKY